MNKRLFWVSTLAVALGLPAGLMCARANATPAPSAPPLGAYQQPPWDQAPPEYTREVDKTGFRAGIRAAHEDIDRRESLGVEKHELFQHPPVDPQFHRDYRVAMRRGYNLALDHWKRYHSW